MTNLPENWTICKLKDCLSITMGQSPNSNSYNENRIGLPFYQGSADFGELHPISRKWCSAPIKIAEKNDVLLSIRAPVGHLNICYEKSCIGRGLSALHGKGNISNHFVFFLLKNLQQTLHENSTGTTFLAITGERLKNISVPLPPLAEQGRIVAKIEELFAGIDTGVENLKSVKNQIALYRQSVLKSAFDFDASTFSALKNLIDKVRYGTSKKCSTEENVNSMPVYRIPNIDFKKGVLDKTDLKFASFDDSEKSSLMLKSGDILIIRSNGSLNLVGRAALVYNTDTNGLYAGYLMRLRIKDTEKLLPKFLLHFLNSGKARAYIEEKAKSTSGVNNINSEEISDLQIPVPTLAEQERIVAEIESRFERADALETAVDRALNDAEKLKQAVLKKAFSGELVPQNPDDEPASVLLDRIRAARASELPAKKGKRKKTEVDSQL